MFSELISFAIRACALTPIHRDMDYLRSNRTLVGQVGETTSRVLQIVVHRGNKTLNVAPTRGRYRLLVLNNCLSTPLKQKHLFNK